MLICFSVFTETCDVIIEPFLSTKPAIIWSLETNLIVTNKTKSIFLAHISQEGNTRQQALQISYDMLKKHTDLSHELIISALGQFEITTKGENDEESSYGSVCCAIGMECFSDSAHT